jgi:hypothetical protein
MIYKCSRCGGDLPLDMTKECPTCFPSTSNESVLEVVGWVALPTVGDEIDRASAAGGPGTPFWIDPKTTGGSTIDANGKITPLPAAAFGLRALKPSA